MVKPASNPKYFEEGLFDGFGFAVWGK